MDLHDIVLTLPLASACAFFSVAAVQLLKNRVRTWTESFFALFFLFGGVYALSDFMFLRSASAGEAMLFLKLGEGAFTLSVVFLYLFTRVFFRRMRTAYLVHLVPALVFAGATWTVIIPDMTRMAWGWDVHYDPAADFGWTAYVLGYAIAGLWNLHKTHSVAIAHDRALGMRVQAVVLGFALCIVAGLASYVIEETELPVFTAAMTVLGLAGLLVASPVSWRSLLSAAKKWGKRRYEVTAAYLMHADGTLINSMVEDRHAGVDTDIFLATLDAIQNFMRVSFPYARGSWLNAIDQEGTRLLIERGELASLVVVVNGEEDEFLRRKMKETLHAFETLNRDRLADWRGISHEAVGTDLILRILLAKESLL